MTLTLIVIAVVFLLLIAAFVAGIAVESRYGKNKYVGEIASVTGPLLPGTPTPTFAPPGAGEHT